MRSVPLALAAVGCATIVGLGAAATPSVTITAYPTLTTSLQPVSLSGRIQQPKAGELVTVEGKECGVPGGIFRALTAAQTTDGGAWTAQYGPRSMTSLRATWGGGVSAAVTVRVRAFLTFVTLPRKRFRVGLYAIGRLAGKRVVIERFDTASRTWRTVRTVTLESDYGEYGQAEGRIALPKGTTLRAVLPLAQAKPCYLAGYSKLVRT